MLWHSVQIVPRTRSVTILEGVAASYVTFLSGGGVRTN